MKFSISCCKAASVQNMGKNHLVKVLNYTFVLFAVFLLASCQKNLTPTISSSVANLAKVSETDTFQQERITDEIPLGIDTLQYSIHTRISSIRTNNSYFDKKVRTKTDEFYARTNFQTRWFGQQAPNSLYYAFAEILRGADKHGLRPNDYNLLTIEDRLRSLYADSTKSAIEIYDLDTQLTDVFFLFSTHLIEGRIKNAGNGAKIWKKEIGTYDDVTALATINSAESLLEEIESLRPRHEQYSKLQVALEHYRILTNTVPADFPIIYSSVPLKPNDVHEAFPLIRRKMALTDWTLDSLMLDSLRYDEVLVDAVKKFQSRHGLEPDGIIGAGTMKFLNQSFEEKVATLELNLERMRWPHATYDHEHIVVNLPEYKLRVFDNQKQELEMKVIVGSTATATPIFSDTLRYIVFSPTWGVPNSIIRDEIIPRLKRDSTYYADKDFTFFRKGIEFDPSTISWKERSINSHHYSVVQQPGKDNSLGLVKFIMPNKMSIYLHDTPNHNLFNRNYKALSHGCVRLDDPDKLAEYLLKDQKGWSLEKIRKVMNSRKTQTVFLKNPYPVKLEYRTAWVDENGVVNFREDIYGHDKRQLEQLKLPDEKIATK